MATARSSALHIGGAFLAATLASVALAAAATGATPPISGIAKSQCITQKDGYYCWFHSGGSGNIQCELRVSTPNSRSYAYCQTFKPPRSATLTTNGRYKVCNGGSCVGNGPENSRTFAAGTTLRVGPFRCRSTASAIRCTVSSGKGFKIGPTITPVP